METMSRGGANLPTSLSGGGLAHISTEVSLLPMNVILKAFFIFDEQLLSKLCNNTQLYENSPLFNIRRLFNAQFNSQLTAGVIILFNGSSMSSPL